MGRRQFGGRSAYKMFVYDEDFRVPCSPKRTRRSYSNLVGLCERQPLRGQGVIESARLRYSTGAGTVGSRVLAARGALKTRNALREPTRSEDTSACGAAY